MFMLLLSCLSISLVSWSIFLISFCLCLLDSEGLIRCLPNRKDFRTLSGKRWISYYIGSEISCSKKLFLRLSWSHFMPVWVEYIIIKLYKKTFDGSTDSCTNLWPESINFFKLLLRLLFQLRYFLLARAKIERLRLSLSMLNISLLNRKEFLF
jgi:hypothetical protein